MTKLIIDELPDAEDRFNLNECIGSGICGEVYSATDTQENDRKVAIKKQQISKENMPYIQEEYRVLKEFSEHPNIIDFYGAFKKVDDDVNEVWFVLELCEGGTVLNLINGLLQKNRRLTEGQIAFILKEVVKAIEFLHQNRVMHRDIKANNILLTKEGDVKLSDFGLCRHLSSTFGKCDSCIGSPSWMAPEVIVSTRNIEDSGYGNRADAWALGITAIELGDGKTPFQDMHPTRALFQIVRNPPPTLYRPANWGETYNDFVAECLEKNAEHRPYIAELMEHPFLAEVPENNYHLTQELKSLMGEINNNINRRNSDPLVNLNFIKTTRNEAMEKMNVEDLASLDSISEETVLQELETRLSHGQFHTFIGDILLVINPNERKDIYGEEYHHKYNCKSRSDNEPHIYSIADSAFQDAQHQLISQNVILRGESGSGKTTNFLHLLDHFIFLGKNQNINNQRIHDGIKLIHALTHASTPINDYSTRCVIKATLTYGRTAKLSGAIYNVYQIEKWRVSSTDYLQSNFHMLYYLYDGLELSDELGKYNLCPGRKYRYLRIPPDSSSKSKPRDNPQKNLKKYKKIIEIFKSFEFTEEQIESILKVLSAVLVLGDVRFQEGDKGVAEIENEDVALSVASLLGIEDRKLCWALTNYCLVKKGTAIRRRHNCDEARDARDVLANTIYCRLVDFIISLVNEKLSVGRTIFGEHYSVKLFDFYGFECFKENHLPQLFINCFNEQLHYHFLQRVFAWEIAEMNEEDVPITEVFYYDNKNTLDQLLSKPDGVMVLVDDASRMGHAGEYVIDYLKNPEKDHIKVTSSTEFAVAHFTGMVTYNVKEMPDRNRDFLPPEVIETIRLSTNKIIKSLFTNKLTKTGNLLIKADGEKGKSRTHLSSSSSDDDKLSNDQFSQIKKMRTAVATFRSLCLDILKELSIGGGSGGTHFVKCIRSDLEGKSNSFNNEIVKQQLRAMAIVDAAKARQKGYPHRISFSEFLRRYKFLAFDFDENVDVSKDNCRLLLIRLKMEGWLIGKTKVFLKYYNEEYLSRLYEIQVKKIIKIQSMMRGYLAKIRIKKQKKSAAKSSHNMSVEEMDEEKAALVLQKAYRGVASRKAYGPLVKNNLQNLDAETCKFIRFYCQKWKAKTIFQTLLQYRAARYHDLFNFSQQVHLFNQNAVHNLFKLNTNIGLDLIDKSAQPTSWLGELKPSVLKLHLRLNDIPFFDTAYMRDPLTNLGAAMEKDESWDSPFKWRSKADMNKTIIGLYDPKSASNPAYDNKKVVPQTIKDETLIHLPYSRDPKEPIRRLSSVDTEPIKRINQRIEKAPTKPPTSYNKNRVDINHFSSKPANQDFEYIKPVSLNKNKPVTSANPIAELKTIGKRSEGNEDDPPFNFQAMLRKTNTSRESIKRTVEGIRNFSIKGRQNTVFSSMDNISNNYKNSSLKKHKSYDFGKQKMELAPGIFMEGYVADL